MWPFKKTKNIEPEKKQASNNQENPSKNIKNEPKKESVKNTQSNSAKKPTKKVVKKRTAKKVADNKIYIGDKKKIITLRLSEELLGKIKHHASNNKKMTLSQFTRHLYNEELTKLENLISKPELNLETE